MGHEGHEGHVEQELADLWFDALASTSTIGMFRTEFGQGIVWVNDPFLEITGLTREETSGDGWVASLHPDDAARLVDLVERARSDPRPIHTECRLVRPDGTQRWARVRAAPVHLDDEVVGYAGALEDLTDVLESAGEAARLAAACQTTSDFIAITDPSGRVTYLNPAGRELMGIARDGPLPELNATDLYTPGSSSKLQTEVLAGLVRTSRWSGELELRAPDGSGIPVSLVATFERGDAAESGHVVVVARDVRAERALIEEASRGEAQFRILAEASPFGIIEISARGEIAFVNQRYSELVGRDVGEVRHGLMSGAHIHADDRDATLAEVTAAFFEQRPIDGIEYRIVRPDGTAVWVRARMRPVFTDDGRFRGYFAAVEDITADVAERADIDRLVAMFDGTPDYASIVEPQGRVLFLNPAARELFGIAGDQSLDDIDYRTFYPDWALDILKREARPGLADQGVWTGEIGLLGFDGREVAVSQTTVVSRGRDGGEWYASISRDITDLMEAEARIAESEAWFRALVTHASDMVVVFDRSGAPSYASPSSLAFSGGDLEGPHWRTLDRVHPDDRDRVRKIMSHVFGNPGSTNPFEARVLDRYGDWRWVECVATNLLDDPAVEGVVTNARDITDRVEAAAALRDMNDAIRQSNETLLAVIENSPLAIYAFGAEGIIQFWNPTCESTFGFSAEEAVGRFAPMVRDVDLATDAALRRQVMAGESIRSTEVRHRHRSGHEIDVTVAAAPMRDKNGDVIAVLVFASDITAEKEQERALLESEIRLSVLAEHASVIITILEADGTVRYTSPSLTRILGHDERANGRINALEHVHPDDRERVSELFLRLCADPGATETVWLRMPHADGSWRDLEAVGNNMLDDPAVHGVVITARDVTEQMEAERALRSSEERFRALVQNLSDVVSLVDEDGTVRWISPAVERLLGYRADEVCGSNTLEGVHPEDRSSIVRSVSEHLERSGPHEPVTFRVRHADGSWRQFESVVDDLRDNPAIGCLVVTSRDVSEHGEAEARLAESEARYRGIVEDQTEMICRYDRGGTLTFVNEAYARYFGSSVDELVGRRHTPFILEDDHARLRSALEMLGSDNPSARVEFRVLRPDGSIHWHEWTHRVVLDGEGRITEFGALGRDITEQREAESLVGDQTRILEMIARGAPLSETLDELCGVVEAHARDVVCSVLLVDDAMPNQLRVGAAPHVPASFVERLDGLPIGPRAGSCGTAAHLGEPVVVTDIGTDPLWTELAREPLAHGLRAAWSHPIIAAPDEKVLGTFCLYSRETQAPSRRHEQLVEMVVHHAAIAIERKRFESQLAHQAHHDPLTGLPNRVLFMEFLLLALARARRYRSTVAVLFLDLDRFKVINDSLGHDVGDEVLVALGERLRSVLRPGDTVARIGGDEFTILCEDLSGPRAKEQAVEVAERLLDVINKPFLLEGEEHYLSASIGIALATTGDVRPEALLRDADAAMYRGKERGKGRWEFFDESMRQSALRRLEIETALHGAIDRGEFRVFYQPCFSIPDGRCVGAEALVRWQHPERGLVAPLEFIGLAEETGLMVPLGLWVLEEACRQAQHWYAQRSGSGFFQVSVNISGRQLAHPELVERIGATIERTGVDPGLICLEITESVLMEDVEGTLSTLSKLKGLGVQLSIDDFGTGYSSLGYLKRFPVDFVKIDQSFVNGLGTDPEDSAIVAAVVRLGHALGLQVVAEGVETPLQLAELEALGCDQFQGYLIALPQPAADVHLTITGSSQRSSEPGLR